MGGVGTTNRAYLVARGTGLAARSKAALRAVLRFDCAVKGHRWLVRNCHRWGPQSLQAGVMLQQIHNMHLSGVLAATAADATTRPLEGPS